MPKQFPFTGTPGLQGAAAQMEEDAHPAEYYELLVTDTILEHIADETNRYAEICVSKVSSYFPGYSIQRSFIDMRKHIHLESKYHFQNTIIAQAV